MKFRSERDFLADVLVTAGRGAASRGSGPPILGGLKLSTQGNRLDVIGTDRDLTIRAELEVIGIEDGITILPAKLCADIVRALEPGAVTLEVLDNEKAEISAARSRFGIRTFTAIEYPSLPDPAKNATKLEGSEFSDALRQVITAASNDDARPLLTGVLMTEEQGSLRLVATDSYRLALRDLSAPGLGHDMLVPAKALAELSRLCGTKDDDTQIEVAPGEQDITFLRDNVHITSRLVSGNYPDYRQLIPEHYPNSLHLGKESLVAALRRMRLMIQDVAPSVKLTMHNGGVDLMVQSSEVGDATETVDGDYSGEELVIAFNPTYLLDGVDAVMGDEVVIETVDSTKPATVKASDTNDFRYLLMPIRVS